MTDTEETKVDANKKKWDKRFIDPMVRFAWNAEIRVEPANRDKGDNAGFRIYPDGTREAFEVT